jgi:hypothetical protein
MRVIILALVLTVSGFATGAALSPAEPAAKPAKLQKDQKVKKETKAKRGPSLFTRGVFALGKIVMPDTGY